jgi:uncharacterized membrane protein
MSYNTFRKWQAIMGMIIGGVTGASVGLGNWIAPIITIIICISVMMVLRRRVKEIVADERTSTVAEKAARLTLQVVAIGMAIIGAIFLIIGRGESSTLTQTGFALEYATCALLVINYIAYHYYNKKLGGRL